MQYLIYGLCYYLLLFNKIKLTLIKLTILRFQYLKFQPVKISQKNLIRIIFTYSFRCSITLLASFS